MVTQPAEPFLVTIVGPTGSGKSSAALRLAQKYGGEIICADSRTIYKGMDIGTAKPNKHEQAMVPHHMLDVVRPDEGFTAAEFKAGALRSMNATASRGNIAFLVGGTGLYVDSVLFDFTFGKEADQETRKSLELLNDDQLIQRARKLGIKENQVNFQNRRHLIRAIERGGVMESQNELRPHTLIIGMQVEADILRNRINQRIDEMISQGLEAEVRQLVAQYGWGCEALSAIGYKEWRLYFEGEQTMGRTRELLQTHTAQYAKRQRTWFRRNRYIHWVADFDEADRLIADFLVQ